eukprot:scaffold165040_cov27-Tisochrysis_lutea.AAC.5
MECVDVENEGLAGRKREREQERERRTTNDRRQTTDDRTDRVRRTDGTAPHSHLTSTLNTLNTYTYIFHHGTHRDLLTDRTRKRMPTREQWGDGQSNGARQLRTGTGIRTRRRNLSKTHNHEP